MKDPKEENPLFDQYHVLDENGNIPPSMASLVELSMREPEIPEEYVPPTKTVGVRLRLEVIEVLDTFAKKVDMTRSELLQKIILNGLNVLGDELERFGLLND